MTKKKVIQYIITKISIVFTSDKDERRSYMVITCTVVCERIYQREVLLADF